MKGKALGVLIAALPSVIMFFITLADVGKPLPERESLVYTGEMTVVITVFTAVVSIAAFIGGRTFQGHDEDNN